jgi:hypothetical protein
MHTSLTICMGVSAFIVFDDLTTIHLKYGQQNSFSSIAHVLMVNGMSVNHQTGLIHGITYHYPLINMKLLN